MLLKPATPLTVCLLAAFVLLLISCLSTPIVKGIPLATYQNVDYGVFGYCQGDKCTNVHVGYSVGESQSGVPFSFCLSRLTSLQTAFKAKAMTLIFPRAPANRFPLS